MKKLTRLEVDVPYKGPGNVINQRTVAFDLYQRGDHYSLVPCLEANERRIANLPEELNFTIEQGKPRSLRGDSDGNFHVITDAMRQLRGILL